MRVDLIVKCVVGWCGKVVVVGREEEEEEGERKGSMVIGDRTGSLHY